MKIKTNRVFMIGVRRNLERPNIAEGGEAIFEFVADPRYGEHSSVLKAKVAYMSMLDPELKGAKDVYVASCFDRRARSLGDIKILRVEKP